MNKLTTVTHNCLSCIFFPSPYTWEIKSDSYLPKHKFTKEEIWRFRLTVHLVSGLTDSSMWYIVSVPESQCILCMKNQVCRRTEQSLFVWSEIMIYSTRLRHIASF